MIDLTFLRHLDRFSLIIKKRITSSYSGGRRSHSFGRGLVFKDFRSYVPGDDFRLIDWRVYGRTEHFYIKTFEEERNLEVHVLVDASNSMDFGRKITKFEYASMIGLGFSYMAMRNNEKFEFSTFAEELNSFKARRGKNQLVSIVDRVEAFPVRGKSEFRKCLAEFKKMIKTTSLIVIVSDLLFDLEELRETLTRFKRNQIIVVQVLDPIEREIDYEGDVILKDSETNELYRTFISRRTKMNLNTDLNTHIENLKHMCDDFNVEFRSVLTDQPIFDVFYNILA